MSRLIIILALCLSTLFTNSLRLSKTQTGVVSPVNLGTAAPFAILSKSGITNVPTSVVTGNVGSSPITGFAIKLTCPQVTGTIYQTDAAGLSCFVTSSSMLTTAVGDMATAYSNAMSLLSPNFTNLGAGNIGGLTLTAGLYKWASSVTINSSVTISGSSTAVWIFQITGTLTQAPSVNIILSGGALPKNIFWAVAGAVSIGSGAFFKGTILTQGAIGLSTGANVKGRLLTSTAVTLQANTIALP